MAGHPGWYPPGQICYPPELPAYLKNVYDLKPVIGVPSDTEVMGIHSVIDAAHRVAGVPGMHDADLLMRLADHLFGVQMAKYRSKYSLITFPSDAMYTPPALPAHVTVTLEPVSGAPSDEEIVRVQEAVRAYQHFSSVPSMFDPLVNMKLSQHLFDIQMARYMRAAGESLPNPAAQAMERREIPAQTMDPVLVDKAIAVTNNAGTGANAAEVHQTSQMSAGVDIRELMERSNQLTERLSKLLERSNELTERCTQPADQSHSQTLAERFNQVLEQLTRVLEPTRRPAEPDQLAERFNQLLDRFNQLSERANQPLQTANELSEKANQIAERSNQLAEQAQKPVERLADILRNVNKVLVAIQHAIIRSHKGNTTSAVDCLVNDRGETPSICPATDCGDFGFFAKYYTSNGNRLPVTISGVTQNLYIPNSSIGEFLDFYGLDENRDLHEEGTHAIRERAEGVARTRLGDYLSSQLG
ncbi:hypothetical protein RSOLAG22IIIB_11185 [Rhizoctonia solani]|uniref:Laminin domain protein n=1 Tax=Rhizoctonia solani TaxID=456999 RepID=A0A0K6G7C5_9AGAM|nr:hypothetical protein RSOLAG22IIIB_11185 [Rhizoctonia solani]